MSLKKKVSVPLGSSGTQPILALRVEGRPGPSTREAQLAGVAGVAATAARATGLDLVAVGRERVPPGTEVRQALT